MNCNVVLTGLLALTLTGCASAEIVKRTYRPTKGGTVRFSSGFQADESRQVAMNKVAEYCQPQGYAIVSEENKKELTGSTTTQNSNNSTSTSLNSADYQYIEFTCE